MIAYAPVPVPASGPPVYCGPMNALRRLALLLTLLLTLAACGQKGPLYLPPPQGQLTAAPAAG